LLLSFIFVTSSLKILSHVSDIAAQSTAFDDVINKMMHRSLKINRQYSGCLCTRKF